MFMNINSNDLIAILMSACDIEGKIVDQNTSFKTIPLDSMDIASFMLEIEERYEIKISTNDISKLDSINQVLEYIIQHLNSKL